jgi:phosphopantetheine adenylyltransferase
MSNQSGKHTEAQPFDLSACASYQICGKGGVFSYLHIDHHSLLNTAFVDNGEKLWSLWGRLSDAEFAQWATSDDIAPEPASYQH